MLRLSRKLIAVLMLLWLPMSGASALAASIAMQAPHGSCHESAMQQEMSGDHQAGDVQDQHASHDQQTSHQSSHNTCGVCHLACVGYLAVPSVATLNLPEAGAVVTPYLFTFDSITSAPIDPPPLARV